MTKTIQPCSWASLKKETEKDLTIKKRIEKDSNAGNPETEDNMTLLFSVLDGLNTLHEKLNKLDRCMKRKIMEHNAIVNTNGGKNEN
jgi:hypothetical protein